MSGYQASRPLTFLLRTFSIHLTLTESAESALMAIAQAHTQALKTVLHEAETSLSAAEAASVQLLQALDKTLACTESAEQQISKQESGTKRSRTEVATSRDGAEFLKKGGCAAGGQARALASQIASTAALARPKLFLTPVPPSDLSARWQSPARGRALQGEDKIQRDVIRRGQRRAAHQIRQLA